MLIEIPKGAHGKKESLPYAVQQKYEKVTVHMNYGNYCLECDEEIANSGHFMYVIESLNYFIFKCMQLSTFIYRGQLKCSKCFFITSCQRAMFNHATLCGTSSDPTNNSVEWNLSSEMHCICGFSSANGNCLAKHLLTCHHSSVYPSFETAQENIAKKNMLDMLGLVRRDGEVTPEPITESAQTPMEEDFPPTTEESIEDHSNLSEKQSSLQKSQTKMLFEQSPEIVDNEPQHNILLPPEEVMKNIQENMQQIEQTRHIDHISQPVCIPK